MAAAGAARRARKSHADARRGPRAYGFVRFRVPSRSDVFTPWYRDFARLGCPSVDGSLRRVSVLRCACLPTAPAGGACVGSRAMSRPANVQGCRYPGIAVPGAGLTVPRRSGAAAGRYADLLILKGTARPRSRIELRRRRTRGVPVAAATIRERERKAYTALRPCSITARLAARSPERETRHTLVSAYAALWRCIAARGGASRSPE
jgi:hypothetical protein